ncbi:MAG: Crp/Fnr family transcriptional regulator [Gammaproteobacteria bacterium]|nr:Crp/Fnr family transcriptional regulator [Gammaproteobacteria bacterium]
MSWTEEGGDVIDRAQQAHVTECLPLLRDASPEFRAGFFRVAGLARLPRGAVIAMEGDACERLALLVAGRVRVYKTAASGKEITLYHIGEGDSCVLTAACIMSATPFPAIAEAQTDVDAVLIPAAQARAWMGDPAWCAFVFGLVSKRLADVIAVLEDVAFQRMDARIAACVSRLAGGAPVLNITHHEIAAELGTSREVVSRILKDFEGRGLVKVGRGELRVTDPARLKALC